MVVAIIGILAAIGAVGYNKYVHNAHVAASNANAKQVADAVTIENTKINICVADDSAGNCARKIARQFNIPDVYNTFEDHPEISDPYALDGCINVKDSEDMISNCEVQGFGPYETPPLNPEYAIFPYQTGHNFKSGK